MPGVSQSAVFATGRPPGASERAGNPFAGTVDITFPRQVGPAGLDVFAAAGGRVARHYDPEADKAVYVVGRATHPSLTGDAFLKWCAQTAADDPGAFRNVLGAFVVLIDDRRAGRVSFVSDPLGLLPWFAGRHDGRLVAGTDVLGICDAGLSAGEADYDSIASWLCYNFVATGGSVVRDYPRVEGGSISTFDTRGEPLALTPYARLTYSQKTVPPDELIEGLYERVHAAFEHLTRGVADVNLPLSGGYDSRLLCAMAAARKHEALFHLTVVNSTPEESLVARRVAEILGLPIDVMPCERSKVDLFDDPLYFLPEGLPTPRNLTNAIARTRPGIPLLSGFLGDGLMRGALTAGGLAYLALDDAPGLSDETLARESHKRCYVETNRLHLLRDPIGPRAQARAEASMVHAIRQGRPSGRAIAHTNLFVRQRLYFAGIFLSHLDVADALLPFPTWELTQYNAAHVGSFASDTYDRLFRRFFPALGGIPHNYRIAEAAPLSQRKTAKHARPTRHLRRWGSELLRGVPGMCAGTAITPHKLLKRLPCALLVEGRYADEIGYLHRIHAFERRLRQANVTLDWSRI